MLLKYPIQPTSSSCPEAAPPAPLARPPLLVVVSLLGGTCIVELDVIWDVCLHEDDRDESNVVCGKKAPLLWIARHGTGPRFREQGWGRGMAFENLVIKPAKRDAPANRTHAIFSTDLVEMLAVLVFSLSSRHLVYRI